MRRFFSYLFLLLAAVTAAACNVACSATSPARLVQRGNDAFEQQNYDEALAAYTQAQEAAPELAEPVYNAANVHYRQGAFDQAGQLLQQALSLADSALAHFSFYNLGNTFFNRQDFATAIEAYKEALRLDPNDGDAKYNLELALQQQAAQEQQEQQEEASQSEQSEQPEEEGRDQEEEQAEQEQEQPQQEQTEQQAQSTPESQGQSEPPPQVLTEEQARQLLEAIGQNTETLPERLQQLYIVPLPPPEQDW